MILLFFFLLVHAYKIQLVADRADELFEAFKNADELTKQRRCPLSLQNH